VENTRSSYQIQLVPFKKHVISGAVEASGGGLRHPNSKQGYKVKRRHDSTRGKPRGKPCSQLVFQRLALSLTVISKRTAHCSLLTAHCSLLTAHCSPALCLSWASLDQSGFQPCEDDNFHERCLDTGRRHLSIYGPSNTTSHGQYTWRFAFATPGSPMPVFLQLSVRLRHGAHRRF